MWLEGQVKEAHDRLLAKLPVRKVECADDDLIHQRGRPKRAVEINGITYESLSDAARALGVTKQCIKARADSGKARYL